MNASKPWMSKLPVDETPNNLEYFKNKTKHFLDAMHDRLLFFQCFEFKNKIWVRSLL
jgi:hypothetical protein